MSDDPLNLGDTTPLMRPVTIQRNGKPEKLDAYVAGKRCPGTIKAQVSAARKEYNELTQLGQTEAVIDPETDEPMMRQATGPDGTPLLDEGGAPILEPVLRDLYHPVDEAWYRMLRLILGAVVLDLSIDEADVLSGDDDRAIGMLKELGWWPKLKSDGTPEGEATGRTRKRRTSRSSSPS